MKAAAVIPSNSVIGVIQHPEPHITLPSEVKLRMLDIGVCGTDREIARFDYGSPPDGSKYLVIGHESLGEIVETGTEVVDLRPGDLVVTTVRRPCPYERCIACRAERQDFCYTGGFTERGINGRHGFMTKFVVEERKYMHRVPHELRDIAVLTEPLTIAEKAVSEVWEVQRRLPWNCVPQREGSPGYCMNALVLGAGPVGLLGAMVLRKAGFNTWMYSLEPASSPRSNIVESIGGMYISSSDVSIEAMSSRIGNIDVVYEATGASKLAFEVAQALGRNAVFVFTGVPGRKQRVEINTGELMRDLVLKNQVLFGTVNASAQHFEAAIADLSAFRKLWPGTVESLITGRFPLDQVSHLLTGEKQGIKSVIEVS